MQDDNTDDQESERMEPTEKFRSEMETIFTYERHDSDNCHLDHEPAEDAVNPFSNFEGKKRYRGGERMVLLIELGKSHRTVK